MVLTLRLYCGLLLPCLYSLLLPGNFYSRGIGELGLYNGAPQRHNGGHNGGQYKITLDKLNRFVSERGLSDKVSFTQRHGSVWANFPDGSKTHFFRIVDADRWFRLNFLGGNFLIVTNSGFRMVGRD